MLYIVYANFFLLNVYKYVATAAYVSRLLSRFILVTVISRYANEVSFM